MILDLFAGPGGWDVGAQQLGLDPFGVETDKEACLTRAHAGLLGITPHDVRDSDRSSWCKREIDGLIASPPCQTFSMAGKGAGRVALEQVLHGVRQVQQNYARGRQTIIPYDEYDDIRTGLVLEPLRYALELEPEWIAWEQVPTVQPVWDACAEVLREDGYHVWTGHLHAEQYGVPQTRKRSVLIASRSRQVGRPAPTHSKFYSRSPQKLDPGVAKWVSMAEALGWSADENVQLAQRRGAASALASGVRPRQLDQPALTVTCAGTRGSSPLKWQFAGAGPAAIHTAGQVRRDLDMPAHTITGKATAQWMPVPASSNDTQDDVAWVYDRPSPTIVGSFAPDVVAAPGYRTTVSRQNAKGSVRVTVQEAAVLQSFPPDYPWQGSKTKQYQQVGNAIPPRLALHVLSEATGLAMPSSSIADDRMTPANLQQPVGWQLRNNTSANAAVRPAEHPAPTLYFGARMNGVTWERTDG